MLQFSTDSGSVKGNGYFQAKNDLDKLRQAALGYFLNEEGLPMHSTASHNGPSEVAILARILTDGAGKLSVTMARYLLNLGFSDSDKARMHDLAVRNQDDALSPAEKEELAAYSKAGTLLSILKSKARRALRVKPKKHTIS